MLSLDASQTALVSADNKNIAWVFYIYDVNGVGYSFASGPVGSVAWATGITWDSGISWDTGEDLSSVVLTDFSGIELRRNIAENTVIAPSEVSFSISNSGGVLSFVDFKGGTVLIELYLSNAPLGERKIASWRFRIKTADPSYQKLNIVAEDFLQSYLRGYYPNTRLPQDIFPSNRSYDNDALCVPVPFGTAYVPLRDVYITGEGGFLLLGDPAYTYAISKIRSPRKWGLKSEYSSDDYTFTQSTKTDADGVSWRVFQAIIADADADGTPDAAGFWGTPGSQILDPPVKFTRSDTADLTNPADVIAFVLKDFGVPADRIDETGTFATAAAIYDGWGLEFNGAFWYRQEREKVLASLLTACHSCLDVGEKIELRVLSKTSKATVTSAYVIRNSDQGGGTFSYRDLANEDLSDAGYVAYQEADEAQDELVKVLVAVDGSASVISSEVLECPYVQDSQNVRRIGQLHFERKLMRQAEVGFTALSKLLAIQPDDRITINDTNYGGSYAVLVDSVRINKDLSLQFTCSDYSISFDDWGDLSPTAVTVAADTSTSSWQPVMSGPDTSTPTSGSGSNVLQGRVRIGATDNYILFDPSDPIRVSVFDSDVEKVRMGNLNGFLGTATDVFGFAGGTSTNYVKIDATTGTVDISGAISGGTIDIGGSDDSSFHVDADGNLWLGAATFNIATNPFAVSKAGVLRAASGTVGGWTLTDTMLKSGSDGSARIELDQSLKRISVKDATNASKVVMGYLDGLAKHDGTGNWGAGDYGFWAAAGDTLKFDGDATYKSGEWVVENDGSLLVQNASAKTIVRLGTDSGSKGLFVYDTSGTQLARYVSDEIYIGDATGHLQYTAASGLTVKGAITADTGYIGGATGWVVSTDTIKDAAGVVGLSSAVTGGDDIRFWAGHATPASAPFIVKESGAITATSATITGTVNANTGYFGGSTNGWVIADGSLTAKGTSIIQTSASAATGIKIDSTSLRGYNGSVQTAEIATDGSGWFGLSGAKAIQWNTSGTVTIAGFTANASNLYTGSKTAYNDANAGIHVGTDGIGIGNNVFTVSSAGALVATSATITGTVNATAGYFGDSSNRVAIEAAGLNVGNSGSIRGGQTDYATGTGFFLGYSGGAYKLSIGTATKYLRFDGSDISIGGDVVATGNIKAQAITADKLTPFTAGDRVFLEMTSILYARNTSYAKFTEAAVHRNGTVRVKFTLKINCITGDTLTAYARIYVNGSAVGTERSITVYPYDTTASSSFSEDIDVEAGDDIQIYGYISYTGGEPSRNYSVSGITLCFEDAITVPFILTM